MRRATKFAKATGGLFVAAGAAAFLLCFGMKALSGRSPIEVFVLFARFVPYHDRYPIPYLLVIALVFAVSGALWLVFITPRFTRFRFLQIILLPWVALILTGPVWGMLWVYHDMPAGFFPAFPHMIDDPLFGARQGLFFARSSALCCLPFNLLAYGAACLLLMICVKYFGSEQPECAQMRST